MTHMLYAHCMQKHLWCTCHALDPCLPRLYTSHGPFITCYHPFRSGLICYAQYKVERWQHGEIDFAPGMLA